MSFQKEQWENSYKNRNNFVFYPHEEVIRFVSRFIRKRTGLNEFEDMDLCYVTPKVLDLGCGIGRHVIYAHEMGFEAYGIDLSEAAVQVARQWAEKTGVPESHERIIQGNVCDMPWANGYFDCVISHGVLDSMHFENAKVAVVEVSRVLRTGGLFYCDLISGDDSAHSREYAGEEIVSISHEEGTMQSYFNYTKINQMITGLFEAVEAVLIKRENVLHGGYTSRYHLVLRRK